MKSRGIFAILAAQVAALVGNATRALRRSGRGMRDTRQGRGGHHGRGTHGQRGLVGAPGAKLWHRLSTRHSRAAGWPGRRVRQYAARGYGYQAPDNVERVGDTSRLRAPA